MKVSRSIDFKKIIRDIRNADGEYVKVELEANFNRSEDEDNCIECDGSGERICPTCEGDGCDDCYGGYMDCEHDEHVVLNNTCSERLLESLPENVKRSIVFSKFYDDGSVDSEFTFTVKTAHIRYIPTIIEAFWSLGDWLGYRDTSGAGMHIAILSDSNYLGAHKSFNRDRLKNFRNQVKKLLPALYFVGTSNALTRDLGYRLPRIGYGSEKYSAIYIINGEGGFPCAIEYRLFDTCYNNPSSVFDYLEVIANTLRYYRDAKNEVSTKPYVWTYSVSNTKNKSLSRLYMSKDKLRVLNELLPYVLPKGININQAKKVRNFKLTPLSIDKVNQRNKDRIVLRLSGMLDDIPEIPSEVSIGNSIPLGNPESLVIQ